MSSLDVSEIPRGEIFQNDCSTQKRYKTTPVRLIVEYDQTNRLSAAFTLFRSTFPQKNWKRMNSKNTDTHIATQLFF